MIKSIRIKNIALIDQAEIDFFDGLNVLSGETGAGKTVIINAINFSLGAKGDKTLIRHGETFCETEVSFLCQDNLAVCDILKEFDIEFDGEIIIKRKLTIDGRSDIKINGSQVTLTMLKRLTLSLCDIYGQSEHYSLLNASNQLKVLDGFIGEEIVKHKSQASILINDIKKAQKTLSESGGDERSRAIRLDVLSYQINEIEKADLKEGEEEEILDKLKLFNNAQRIGERLSLCSSAISGDGGTLDILSTVISKFQQITDLSPEYENIYDRLYSVKSELEDIGYTTDNLLSDIDFNEREKELIEERLDLIKTLKRKYGNSYNEIMEYFSKLQEEYENLHNFEEVSKECEELILTKTKELKSVYDKMFLLREKYAKDFSKNVELELSQLGMNSAKFEISITRNDKELVVDGDMTIEFLFSANKGEPLKNMSKVISGGEMSRFMLALKIVANENGETYIFDEIDAGISGEVAKIVAQKFIKLSKNSQIITISHLPQIVSYADNNYLICKNENDIKTVTSIKLLDYEGKVNEIIRLTGGGDVKVARLNAVSAIQIADEFKRTIRQG